MPGFPTKTVGTPTNRGKARRYKERGSGTGGMAGKRSKPAAFKPKAAAASSSETIVAASEEFQQSKVTQHLELLADFVADVGVVGMEFGQGASVSVYVGESEFEFA